MTYPIRSDKATAAAYVLNRYGNSNSSATPNSSPSTAIPAPVDIPSLPSPDEQAPTDIGNNAAPTGASGSSAAPINYQAATYTSPTLSNQSYANNVLGSGGAISDNALVSTQFNNLISPDSPLMQMSRTGALQSQNASGRLNTSMAQTASDLAAYQAAIPLAQQDASTYATADLNAQNAFNQGGLVQQAANYDNQTALIRGAIEGALQSQMAQDSITMEQLEHANNMQIADAQYDQVITSALAAAMTSLLGDTDITDMIGARDSLLSTIQEGLEW